MLTVRLQSPFLIKERSSRPPGRNPPITQHFYLIGLLYSLTFPITPPTSQGPHPVLAVFSHDPHLLLSPFNPYLSDPLTLFLLMHLSHNVVSPLFSLSHDIIIVLLTLRELSHYLVTVTHCTPHT